MNLKKNWKLKVDPGVYKDLSKFPKDYTKKILGVILSLSDNPYGGDIEKIKGEENTWRRRIGSYRVFYEIHSELNFIHILWVERRSSNTY
jgi:mRNA interferase RelE/StbE